jgi:hypothetical protein
MRRRISTGEIETLFHLAVRMDNCFNLAARLTAIELPSSRYWTDRVLSFFESVKCRTSIVRGDRKFKIFS